MARTRLVAMHALALVMTVATITMAAIASSVDVDLAGRARWVVVALGVIASAASIGFARITLRELDRLTAELRLTRIDTAVPRTTRCDAAELVHAVVTRLRPAAQARGVKLDCDRAEGALHVDVAAITRTLEVLVGLAIATNQPGAGVEVDAFEAAGGVKFVVSSVAAVGDSPVPSSVWETDAEVRRCQRVVEAQGGRLAFEVLGSRSSCWFTLTAEPRVLR